MQVKIFEAGPFLNLGPNENPFSWRALHVV